MTSNNVQSALVAQVSARVYVHECGVNCFKPRRAASPSEERKTAGLTARAVVVGDPRERRAALPTGSRGTRERGGVGLETIPNKKRATEAQTAEEQRVSCPRGGRGSETGPRMSEARGRWGTTPSKVCVFKDLLIPSTCVDVCQVSTLFSDFGVLVLDEGLLLCLVVGKMLLSNSEKDDGKRWNLVRHS